MTQTSLHSESAPEPLGPPDVETTAWGTAEAADLYGLPLWGLGHFGVNDGGHATVIPSGNPDGPAIDIAEVVEGLEARGVSCPVLLRFPDLLESRMKSLRAAFDRAIEAEQYQGDYHAVFPIKVNQQRNLVERIRDIALGIGFGLEAGSKPELLAVLSLTEGMPDMPIICNGFKDDEYVETVILAHKLGRRIYPVVEAFPELQRILSHADRYGVRPNLGVRVKPSAPGAGKWADSTGERSKFGLHPSELIAVVDRLNERGMADCLKLVHFHVGSQVCEIRQLKNAISELARFYCELRRLGAGLEIIDVGGGLAVDYDGSRSAWSSSMDYSIDEYATDIVYRIKAACDDAKQPHPTIISESGRAMVAHSSVLVFDVIGRTRFKTNPDLPGIRALIQSEEAQGHETARPVLDLIAACESLEHADPDPRKLAEAFHDAQQARAETISLFRLGYVTLPARAAAERLYLAVASRVLTAAESSDDPALDDVLDDLPQQMSDIYFGNLSIFQSLPDSWAIDQLFPVLPIHRLDERPDRRAIIADVTCDSDGALDRFACTDTRDFKPTLEVHDLHLDSDGAPTEPYRLGVFLVGAYQEVLGDLHNLFGDAHAVFVSLDEQAGWKIDEIVEGDRVSEVLGYLQYDASRLRESIRRETEAAVRRGNITVPESRSLLRFYESGLEGYTYLE